MARRTSNVVFHAFRAISDRLAGSLQLEEFYEVEIMRRVYGDAKYVSQAWPRNAAF
jgi:hypothetical protein